MQCNSCHKEIKDSSKFCKHCGQPTLTVHTAQSEEESMVELKAVVQPDKQALTSETPAANSWRLSAWLALISAVSSAVIIWALSFAFSSLSNRSLLTAFWDTIVTQFLHIPLEKAVLLEQQLQSSVWFIANSFIGGSLKGQYLIDGQPFAVFKLQSPILLILLGTALIAWLHLKMISAQMTRRQRSFGLIAKVITAIIYMLATWLLIALPLLLFAPSLHIPFIDAPERLNIRLVLLTSLLNTACVIATSAIFAWIPWKQWGKCRQCFSVAIIFTVLLGAGQLFVQLWTKSGLAWQQLFGLHSSGLDLLWLNRFATKLLMSFGGNARSEHSFYAEALALPHSFTWNLSLIVIIGAAILAIFPIAHAARKERIGAAALILWMILVLFQLTGIQMQGHLSIDNNDLSATLNSFVYQLDWMRSIVIPAIIIVVLLVLGKWLESLLFNKLNAANKGWISHLWSKRMIYSSLLLLLLIALNTSFDISRAGQSSLRETASEKMSQEALWAQQVYLMQEAAPQYALMKAKELWAEQGTAESKALLAIAYLQAYQPNRANDLLQESLKMENKLFSADELSKLIQVSDLSDPLSAVYQGPEVASSDTSAVVYSLQEAMDTHVQPEISELLVQTAEEVLPELVGKEITAVKTQMKLDPEYLDFMKALAPDKLDQLQVSYHDASSALETEIDEIQEAIYALETKEGQSQHETADAVHSKWTAFIEPRADYVMSLARAAVYFGDKERAESWLTLVNHYVPGREDAAVLLSSLYLNGEQPSSAFLEQSTAYDVAVQQASKALKAKLEAALKDVDITTEAALQQKLDSAYITEDMRNQLAYALLLPYENNPSTDVLYQLAKYYFQTDQEDKADDKIAELEKRVSELEIEQQYLIQKLSELPANTSEMTVDQIQEKHELTEELYVKLEPTEGKAFSEQPLTGEQQAFSVYLSNKLLSFQKSSAHITSVQYKDGKVTVFARSDNAELTKSGLSLFDNNSEIKDFELTKMSETSSFDRYVMLILDKSGSMDGQKIEVAKQSAIDFVNALQHKETVGLIEFSSGASLAQPFTSSYAQMSQALAMIQANGGTDIAPALNLGIDGLQESNGERIAFILSDGEDSNFSDAAVRQQIIKRANAAGITIYAVGFDAGYQTLRDVAEGTGGQYIGASDFESLSRSFDTIRETLSRTYQIRYSINAEDYGLHTVRLEEGEYADSKTYTIVDPNPVYFPTDDSGEDGFSVGKPTVKSDAFSVTSYSPRRIVISKSGSTKITIQGTKLSEVESIQFGGKPIDFKRASDEEITVSVSNQQRVGTHSLKLVTKDRKEETLTLTFSNSDAQQSYAFGYATLYGDFIESSKGNVKLVGDVSIDHFIYPSSDSMQLRNDEELTFKGVNLKMNKTTVRMFQNNMTMTSSNFGKQFSVESQGAISQAASSLPGLDRFGIELKIIPVMSYTADMRTDDGTYNLRGGMTNFYKLYMLNQNINKKIKVKGQPVKWLPSDSSASIDYTKSSYTLTGTVGASLYMQGLGFDGVTLSFTYPQSDKRLILKGQLTGMELFSMKTSRTNSSRFTLEIGVHFTNGLDRLGAELASNRSVPLGPSGLGLYKLGFLADWSAKNAGSLTLGIDTVIDTAYTKFTNSIAKIPVVNKIFDFDPAMCILCVDGTIGFTELGTTNWGLNGKITAELIGFKVADVSTIINKNEIGIQTMMNRLIYKMDSSGNIVFKDTAFRNHTTLKFRTMIDAVGLNPHTFTVVYVPAKFDYSYAELSKEKKGKTVVIQRIGSKLNIVR